MEISGVYFISRGISLDFPSIDWKHVNNTSCSYVINGLLINIVTERIKHIIVFLTLVLLSSENTENINPTKQGSII